ncbi:MAG: alpha/beta fold hydrolase [Terriglobales bacterium]|jgi:esterase/lipase superfamily enzyme
MQREYKKEYSHELGREMESLVFGHGGQPILVFPSSMGRFFEYEDSGMIGALAGKIEAGQLQVFCPDSIDGESWYNKGAHPGSRIWRHVQYERYILHEYMNFVRWKNCAPQIAVTGCSFGGYHALNFSMRHPDLVLACVTMSGSFDIRSFLDGYYDDNVYFNNPSDYLANMSDDWYLSRYRQMKIVLGTSDWDMCLDANIKMDAIMSAKRIPHWLDIYGDNSKHDWPLWQRMAGKYF